MGNGVQMLPGNLYSYIQNARTSYSQSKPKLVQDTSAKIITKVLVADALVLQQGTTGIGVHVGRKRPGLGLQLAAAPAGNLRGTTATGLLHHNRGQVLLDVVAPVVGSFDGGCLCQVRGDLLRGVLQVETGQADVDVAEAGAGSGLLVDEQVHANAWSAKVSTVTAVLDVLLVVLFRGLLVLPKVVPVVDNPGAVHLLGVPRIVGVAVGVDGADASTVFRYLRQLTVTREGPIAFGNFRSSK